MFANLLNSVTEYTVHTDIVVRRYTPTRLGASLGYKAKTVVAQTGGIYGMWLINGIQSGSTEIELTAGTEIVAQAMFITHRFVLTDDSNVMDYVSIHDHNVYNVPSLIDFNATTAVGNGNMVTA